MARGRERHQARLDAINALGKNLSRRASSKCELCEDSLDLRVIEIGPVPDEPDEDYAILACPRCRDLIDSKRLPRETDTLRFLDTSVWSETVPAQIAAIRLLRRLAADQVEWAVATNDTLWIAEEVEERL